MALRMVALVRAKDGSWFARKGTPIHELERYMRCKDCSQVRRYAYKRSHLVALRTRKISASDPPPMWWPGER
jgi:hypothetical protein